MLFETFFKEVSIALENSCILDFEDFSVKLQLDGKCESIKGMPVKNGALLVNSCPIANVFVAAIAKPNIQFYDEIAHCNVHSFDVIDIDDNMVYYMQGNWIYGNIATQEPLCYYAHGSNLSNVLQVFFEWQEKKHKEAYDNEIEED